VSFILFLCTCLRKQAVEKYIVKATLVLLGFLVQMFYCHLFYHCEEHVLTVSNEEHMLRVLRKILLSRREEVRGDYVMRSFIICTHHLLFRPLNEEE
jgi:hypothetical protein